MIELEAAELTRMPNGDYLLMNADRLGWRTMPRQFRLMVLGDTFGVFTAGEDWDDGNGWTLGTVFSCEGYADIWVLLW